MAYAPYEFLFTDQNPNREFVVQPYTTNGPSSPDGSIDPSAANANTTLFLYGKGSPNYGDRIQENLVFMMEHFFSPIEPSFPIPGQLWCQSSSDELTTPFQMYMLNPRKFRITASGTNQIYVVSDDGSLTLSQILARFTALGLTKQFTVFDINYNSLVFVQSALPVISGLTVLLTVVPAVPGTGLVGQFIGGWEEIYQGNAEIVLRRPFNANGYNIINLAAPVNPQDATTKAYVDAAVPGHGGPIINLASAVTYGIGASSTITASTPSSVTGNVFLSPAGSITGTITVSGTTHNGDTAAATALTDANNAFVAGNALVGYTTIGAALGGTSPAPGYYTTGSSFNITGTLTLNGPAGSIWVFKSPSSTLITAVASHVVLTGGALPQDVYWLVGSSATFGTTSTFVGTVIAHASITDDGGSSITGHLFALTAAVTLNNTTVIATPAGSPGPSGTLTLGGEPTEPGTGLSDVIFQTPNNPQTGAFLYYNGINWTDLTVGSFGFLPLVGGTMMGTLNMNGNSITNLAAPVSLYDAARKEYVDLQPLSAANVSLPLFPLTPNNNDLLVYNSITNKWNNSTAAVAGVVPISGSITFTGPISMGGQVLTGVPTPVNPTDATNKTYVDGVASNSGVASGTFNSVTGILTLTNGILTTVNIFGLTTPTTPIVYVIPVPATSKNQFFALNAGQSNPGSTTVTLALNELDAALGNFVVPRQQLVFTTPGTRTAFDINNLAWYIPTPAYPPACMFVKGSHNLAVYLNGIRQTASTSGIAIISSSVIRDDFDITFPGGSCQVNVNALGVVTATIGTQTTLGGVRDALNALALSHFINPIATASSLQFTVPGNVASAFPATTQFTVNYSGNPSGTTNNDTTTFTVSGLGSTYAAGFTTINVTLSIPVSINAGVIFQNNWGFSVSIENGAFVFYSNLPGTGSSVAVTDINLFSSITGITYPITGFGSLVTIGNSLPPATYGYSEIGMNGYLSSLIDFTPTAPPATETMEIIIDREIVYNSTNPLAAANIA